MQCLVCAKSVEPFHRFDKKAIMNKPVRNAGAGAVATLDLAYCQHCQHISSEQKSNESSESLSKLIYEELYEGFGVTALSKQQTAFTHFLADWLMSTAGTSGSALEVGCHDGFFLNLLKQKGWTVRGVEPSPHAKQAQSQFGIEVHQGFFHGDLLPASSFDLVVCRHVVEHVPQPTEFVASLAKTVKPGGLLYLEVPNSYQSLQERIFLEFHIDHISYFTPQSLQHVLNLSGDFEILHFESAYSYMRFPFLHLIARKRSDARNPVSPKSSISGFSIESAMRRFKSEYSTQIANLQVLKGRPLGLWGSGSVATQFAIDGGWDSSHITAVDPAQSNQGKFLSVSGIRVESPDVLLRKKVDAVILASGWESDVLEQARALYGTQLRLITPSDLTRTIVWG